MAKQQQTDYQPSGDLPVEETVLIPSGNYEGVLSVLGIRTQEHQGEEIRYLDLETDITYENDEGKNETVTLRTGFPARITPGTMLGKLLVSFGVPVKDLAGKDKINPTEILDERLATFTVKRSEDGFSEIVRESILPAE